MKIWAKQLVLGLVLAFIAGALGFSQQKEDADSSSLGDIARQLKAQKSKEPKPVKVITNDNLDGTEVEASTPESHPKDDKSAAPAAEGAETPKAVHNEAYFRKQMSVLKSRLDTHQRELDVLQQKLGQNQMQYYNDPSKSLMQQYSREDINKFTADIDAKKQEIADDNKAIDDLHDQLRHDGGDPGWLR
jgi:hypothetical protein